MNSALHSKEYFSRYLIALVCFLCVHSPTESHSGYKDSIKGVISGIKDELTKSKNGKILGIDYFTNTTKFSITYPTFGHAVANFGLEAIESNIEYFSSLSPYISLNFPF